MELSGPMRRFTRVDYYRAMSQQGVPVGTWLLGRFSGTGYQASALAQFDGMTGLTFAPPGLAATR